MKLLEIEVNNIRGIRNLVLKPEGENVVVWGPNGAGKSGLIDAIDFLLRGEISRLTGEGTEGISLQKHGTHVDSEPANAFVRARLEIPGAPSEVLLQRSMASPGSATFDPSLRSFVEQVFALARNGQYMLTRRDILRFITAPAGTRGQRAQKVLNIAEIDDIRSAIVNVRNQTENEGSGAESSLAKARADIARDVGLDTYTETSVLERINAARHVLGGAALPDLRSADVKQGLSAPTSQLVAQAADFTGAGRSISALLDMLQSESIHGQIVGSHRQMLSELDAIRADPRAARDVALQDFLNKGLSFLDQTGSCPLCEYPWPPGELRQRLQDRIQKSQVAAAQRTRLQQPAGDLKTRAETVRGHVALLKQSAPALNRQDLVALLDTWEQRLSAYADALQEPLENADAVRSEEESVGQMLAPDKVVDTLQELSQAIASRATGIAPDLVEWDLLTKAEASLPRLHEANTAHSAAVSADNLATNLLQAFEAAREETLASLYDAVCQRFVDFYRSIHNADEAQFSADISPEGPSLHFNVDFFDRGKHPPHALHSEGHQDSMGLCLYLALYEYLTGGRFQLVLLDDVVMSIDDGHRKEICTLMAKQFPNRQFIITTHDKDWAFQLRQAGIVKSKNMVRFYRWDLASGPLYDSTLDSWSRIDAYLADNDVPHAALELRRSSEQFLLSACAGLKASVPCKPLSDWDLGELLPAALERHRELLGRAKSAANKRNDSQMMAVLQQRDDTGRRVRNDFFGESPQVNRNIHYSVWHQASAQDFRGVVNAFRELWALFKCPDCESVLTLSTRQEGPDSIVCNCGRVSWVLAD
jgi:energy-coupling factor transporter ATP-binding protein EcfA2